MNYFCSYCGEVDTTPKCPECGRWMEEYKSSLKSKRTMVNIDKQLLEMESKEEFRKMFGEYFNIRGKK